MSCGTKRNSKYSVLVTNELCSGYIPSSQCIASDPDDEKARQFNSTATMSSCHPPLRYLSFPSKHAPQYDVVTPRHRFEQFLTDSITRSELNGRGTNGDRGCCSGYALAKARGSRCARRCVQ